MAWGLFLNKIVKPALKDVVQFNPTSVVEPMLYMTLSEGSLTHVLGSALSPVSLTSLGRFRASSSKAPLCKHRLHYSSNYIGMCFCGSFHITL